MTRIAVIGGTGYAGSHIVAEAASRGHTVVSIARSVPVDRVAGATYLEGTLLDVPSLVRELQGVEVVLVSVPARGDMRGLVRPSVTELVQQLPDPVRVGVIGGAGGSLIAEGGPRVIDAGGFPEEFKPEAAEAVAVLDDLRALTTTRDWFFIHPAQGFGAFAPGERTGRYRDGGEVLVTDDDGQSYISGADFALAVIDEIESPKHPRQNFTVGY